MTEPSDDIYDWASDTNWSSGPRSGSPTKGASPPNAATIQQGGVAGQSFKATHWNSLGDNLSRWSQYFRDQIRNVLDGGSDDSQTELRDILGVVGEHVLLRPAAVISDLLVPGSTSFVPNHPDPAGGIMFPSREVTTSASPEDIVVIHDIDVDMGTMIDVSIMCELAGSYFRQTRHVLAVRHSSSSVDLDVDTVSDQSAGVGTLSGLAVVASLDSGGRLSIALTDSSQPRTIRVTGWIRHLSMHEV